MKPFHRIITIGAALCIGAVGAHVADANTSVHAPHRHCPEDAVWIGDGNFAHGYWSHYKCVSGDSATAYWLAHN